MPVTMRDLAPVLTPNLCIDFGPLPATWNVKHQLVQLYQNFSLSTTHLAKSFTYCTPLLQDPIVTAGEELAFVCCECCHIFCMPIDDTTRLVRLVYVQEVYVSIQGYG